MKKNYMILAALAGMLSLTACSGKPANEQAAADAQKIDVDSMIPEMAASLVEACSGEGADAGCVTDKVQDVIKEAPSFKAAIADYDQKCAQSYSAKMCAQGYATYLTDSLAARLVEPVSTRATASLKTEAEQQQRAQEAEAQAKAEAEAAAAQAEAAAEEARKAQEAAEAAAGKAGDNSPATSAPAEKPSIPALAAPKAETPVTEPGDTMDKTE